MGAIPSTTRAGKTNTLTVVKKPRKKTAKKAVKKDPNMRGKCKQAVGWISKQVVLTTLYRIKGAPGLWVPNSVPNANKILQAKRYLRVQTCTVHLSKMQQLTNALIYDNEGGAVPLPWALDNLQEHFKSETTGDLKVEDKEKLMEIICPNYDKKHFKDYHAMKIIKWYNEIIYSLNEHKKDAKEDTK